MPETFQAWPLAAMGAGPTLRRSSGTCLPSVGSRNHCRTCTRKNRCGRRLNPAASLGCSIHTRGAFGAWRNLREFCRLSLNEGKVVDGGSQSVDPTGPSARLIGCTIRFECSRSGSSAPSGQKPQAAYRRVAGVSPAVTPKKTRFTPTLSAQKIASLSKARPAPIPRDAGSTHIWKRWATAGSSLDNLHQIRPHASSRLNAKRTRSLPDDVAVEIRADHIASVLVASASCVLPKASGESSSARRRMSR